MKSIRRPALLAALLVCALATLVAACGGGDEETDTATAKASGEITVWAPGVEGEKLPILAKDFEKANPGVKVNVTPIPIEQAHNKILTSIAGNETPDISWVGSPGWASSPRPARSTRRPSSIDMEQFFEGARDAVTDRRQGLRRAVARRDARPLLPDRHRQEGRRHRGAQDVGRAQDDGAEDAEGRRRQVRHQPQHQQLAGVGALRVAERRRARRRRHLHARHAGGRSRRRTSTSPSSTRSSPRPARRRGSTSCPRSCAARTRCSSPARGTSGCSTIRAARASTRSTPSPDAQAGDRDVVRRRR